MEGRGLAEGSGGGGESSACRESQADQEPGSGSLAGLAERSGVAGDAPCCGGAALDVAGRELGTGRHEPGPKRLGVGADVGQRLDGTFGHADRTRDRAGAEVGAGEVGRRGAEPPLVPVGGELLCGARHHRDRGAVVADLEQLDATGRSDASERLGIAEGSVDVLGALEARHGVAMSADEPLRCSEVVADRAAEPQPVVLDPVLGGEFGQRVSAELDGLGVAAEVVEHVHAAEHRSVCGELVTGAAEGARRGSEVAERGVVAARLGGEPCEQVGSASVDRREVGGLVAHL